MSKSDQHAHVSLIPHHAIVETVLVLKPLVLIKSERSVYHNNH